MHEFSDNLKKIGPVAILGSRDNESNIHRHFAKHSYFTITVLSLYAVKVRKQQSQKTNSAVSEYLSFAKPRVE